MPAYLTELDIANKALQLLRRNRIYNFTDHTAEAQESAFLYPLARDAELRAHFWRFATRRVMLYPIGSSTYLWTPPTWSSASTYSLGHVVVDSLGNWWQSKISTNTAQLPNTKNGIYTSSSWQPFFGSDALQPFVAPSASSLTAPSAPTLSAVTSGALGARTVYVKITYTGTDGESLVSSESMLDLLSGEVVRVTSPAASTGATGYNVYASDTASNEVLQTSTPTTIGVAWTESVTGLTPYGAQPPVSQAATFFAGDLTFLPSTGAVYLSLYNDNSDTPPTTQWVAVSGTYAPLQILYPIGAGPRTDPNTRNVYRLPRGYLLRAPTDPRRTATPAYLGASVGNYHEDWVFEGNYIISAQAGPLMLRYVADFLDVPSMDAAFCEMVAAKMAEDLSPRLLAADAINAGMNSARRAYKLAARRAAGVNAIEVASMDPEFHDFVACRA